MVYLCYVIAILIIFLFHFLLKTMEIQEGICRLCLKVCDKFKAIDGNMKEVLDVVLLPKIDLATIRGPVMCPNCTEMLIKCFDFKTACLDTSRYLVPFIKNKDIKLNLKDVYLSKNENGTNILEDEDVCGFCMGPVKNCSAISVDFEGNIVLKNMIEQCLPELDISIIDCPVICEPCYASLGNYFSFVTSCLSVEKKIKEYRETLDVNTRGGIELTGLLQFTLKDVKSEVDGGSVDLIKPEEQFCDSENAEEEIDVKIENFMDIDDTEFNNDQQFSSNDMMECKEESNNANEIAETFSEKNESQFAMGMEDQKFLVKEEIEIKTDEQDRLENDVSPQPKAINGLYRNQAYLMPNSDPSNPYIKRTSYNCVACSYWTLCEDDIDKHSRTHKELPVEYKCNFCSYRSELRYRLKRHLLVHSDPSEIRMYKCNSCSYTTKYAGNLKKHSLVHKEPSEVAMYKCNSCSYQAKFNYLLKRHLLVHRNPSEMRTYKCKSCPFRTEQEGSLKVHARVHRVPSEYKCNACSYRAKLRHQLKKHSLVHKDPSEIRMYKCTSCSYQAKRKCNLESHLLVHKDPSEVAMYKCTSCSFQTKYEGSLKTHLLVHREPSEAAMYESDARSFQIKRGGSLKTKREGSLKGCSLVHRDPSEVAMYKCSSCPFQTKRKGSLKEHSLVHKDPTEVAAYSCESCSYRTKYKRNLRAHSLLHQGPAGAATYRCSTCSYATRYTRSFKVHLVLHKDPSGVVA